MLGHDNVTEDLYVELEPSVFKRRQKCILHPHLRQKWLPAIATEGEEMGLPRAMKSYKSIRHGPPPNYVELMRASYRDRLEFPTHFAKSAKWMGHGAVERR